VRSKAKQQRGRRVPVLPPIQPAGTDKRYWKFVVTRGGCVMCKEFPLTTAERRGRELDISTIEGHHILAKRHLRVHHVDGRFWDIRNGLPLCRLHHHRHEWRMQPVPFRLLPDDALEFAGECDLLYVIENEYPGIEDLQ
jgi:hypothetical protein